MDEIAFINSLQADLVRHGFETKLKKGEARRLRHHQERATQPLLQPVRANECYFSSPSSLFSLAFVSSSFSSFPSSSSSSAPSSSSTALCSSSPFLPFRCEIFVLILARVHYLHSQ